VRLNYQHRQQLRFRLRIKIAANEIVLDAAKLSQTFFLPNFNYIHTEYNEDTWNIQVCLKLNAEHERHRLVTMRTE